MYRKHACDICLPQAVNVLGLAAFILSYRLFSNSTLAYTKDHAPCMAVAGHAIARAEGNSHVVV